MKRIILICLFMLLLIPFASAEIIVSPQSSQKIVYVGVEEKINISLKNTFDFNIYNLTLSENGEGITLPQIDSIPKNSSINTTINILTTSSFEKTINPKILFYYLTPIIKSPEQSHVIIKDTGFIPNTIDIYQGWTIEWKNNGSVSHTILANDLSFESPSIAIGSSFVKTFDNVETIGYHDKALYFGGIINVLNKTTLEPTHNQGYDKIIDIELTSKFVSTELEVEAFDLNLTIRHNNYKESIIKIKNLGENTAYNVVLNMKWGSFSKNDFSISQGGQTYIPFTISPIITNVEDTNKTHNLLLTISSQNAETKEIPISVFIPYEEFLSNVTLNMTNEELFEEIQRLSRILALIKFPDENITIVYKDSEFNVTYTQQDVYDIKLNYELIRDDLERQLKAMNRYVSLYETDLNQTLSNMMERLVKIEKSTENTNKIIRSMNVRMWLESIFKLFLLIGGVLLAIFIIKSEKIMKKKEYY